MMQTNKTKIIIISAIILGFMYCLSINFAYSEYLNIRNTDPLAMLHSLFPFCYIVMVFFAVLCFTCVLYEVGNKYIHFLLLIQFSLMLWFTPFYFSSLPRETDSLWHAGISNYSPELGKENQMMFSYYYEEYPTSFIFNHLLMKIMGIDHFIYARLLYPLFNIIFVVFFCYIFISRLFTYKIAFLSILIMILSPFPPQLHVAPSSFGTLLVLISAIVIITYRYSTSIMIGLLLVFTLITIHPISPLIILIFMVSEYILKVFIYSHSRVKQPYSLSGIPVTLCGWFSWALFYARRTETNIAESLYNILTLNFARQLEIMRIKATHKGVYVYPEISLIGKIVSYSYLIIPLIFFFREIIGLDLMKGIKNLFLKIRERLPYERLLMVSIALFSLLLSVAFVFSSIEVEERVFYLWQRGFFYVILSLGIYVGSSVLFRRDHSSCKTLTSSKAFVICWLIFLALSYQIIHSEPEAYLIYPTSEDNGMRFLQSSFELSGKYLSMYMPQQLASYLNTETHFHYHSNINRMHFLSTLYIDDGSPSPDILVFRRTEFFLISYNYDKSFKNNRYINALTLIEGNSNYNMIYYITTFKIFLTS